MNDTPLEWIALGISIVGLAVAIAAAVFNYRYTLRMWGMHEDYKRLARDGVSHAEIERQIDRLWPWWRFK